MGGENGGGSSSVGGSENATVGEFDLCLMRPVGSASRQSVLVG